MKDLRKYGYKRIDTLEAQKYLSIDDYEQFVRTDGEGRADDAVLSG